MTAIVLTATLVLASHSPAQARESIEPAAARPVAGVDVPAITRWEARRVTEVLLRSYIAPAVTNNNDAATRVTVRGCRVEARRGLCRGSVRTGVVSCSGVFRVFKFRRSFSAWPLRMQCSS